MKTSCSSSYILDLGVTDGHEVVVADATTPKPISLVVKYSYSEEGLKLESIYGLLRNE